MTDRRCSRCGKPLSDHDQGLCPSCLVLLGLGAAGETTLGTPAPVGTDTATVLGTPTPDAATVLGTAPGSGPQKSTTAERARDRAAGDLIGPYRLVKILGEGGMGVVYLAEQTEPIRRTVALKLIKLGMDTREVVARFEAERQTLALMDHPNIASVLDAGATADGRPYFVMEYAPGVPITEYCDAHQLDTTTRLELFITVCGAVQHAHQKGVIHRDLKPSNVLIVEQDGVPTPKVIDFGIAKATDQRMAERTQFTQHGLLVGTPEYMSPEQTDPLTADLDTRTDVYALGVMLYELLVGGLPFAPTRLREAGYTELLRIIREEEPPKPSARLTSLGTTATDVAAKRRTKPPTLAGELSGDLDWITLKALEKDRARRYGSASDLAADLTRYLQHEPVAARPPSMAYRVSKFVRRNRIGVAAAALVAAALMAGLIVSLALYARAERNRRDAVAERGRANEASAVAQSNAARAEQAATLARTEADRASSSFATAMGMAQPLEQALRESILGDMRLQTSAVLEIVARADASYKSLEAQDAAAAAQEHAAFLVTASQALCDVGHLTDGIARAEQALAILDARLSTGVGSVALRAEALYARGNGYAMTGRMAQARKDLAAAIVGSDAEAQQAGWTFELMRLSALSEIALGDLDRWALAPVSAEQHYQRAIATVANHPLKSPAEQEQASIWKTQAWMGSGLNTTSYVEQERRYAVAAATVDALARQNGDSMRVLRLIADLGAFRSRTATDLKRGWRANRYAADGETAANRLSQRDRDNLQWQWAHARTQRGVAYVAAASQNWAAARTALEPAERAAAALTKAEPLWRQARYLHGAALYDLAEASRASQPDKAAALASQARDEFVVGIRNAPGDLDFVRGLSLALGALASDRYDHKDYDAAIDLSKQALAALEPAERRAPGNTLLLSNKQFYYWQQGAAWWGKSNWKDAIDAFTTEVNVLTTIALSTRLASDESALAGGLVALGDVLWASGDKTKAGVQYDRASGAIARALAMSPLDPDTVHQAVQVHDKQIGMLSLPADVGKALDRAQSVSTLVWNALLQEPWNSQLQSDLAQLNSSLTTMKQLLPRSGLPDADAANISSRVDSMLADRQASKLFNWVIRPLMPGPWLNLTGDELAAARRLVHDAFPDIVADQVFAVRALTLSFRASGDRLYEAGVDDGNGNRGIVAFIDQKVSSPLASRFLTVDGTSPSSKMNGESAPLLDTPARATDYFRFFMGALHASLGPFVIVEKPEDFLWRTEATVGVKTSVQKYLLPVQLTRQADGTWATDCTLVFGTTLYKARMTMSATGALTIGTESTRLLSDVPVQVEMITDGVKTLHDISDVYARQLSHDLKQLEANRTDRVLLSEAIDLTLKLNRRQDTAPLQERLVDVLKADPKTKTAELVGAYVSLSWYQLFARDFAGSLAATDAGRKLDPQDLYLETNRAHALLFLGRTADAETVYRAHIGQKMSATSNKVWEDAILGDFDDLEKAGVTSPEFARLRRILKHQTGRELPR